MVSFYRDKLKCFLLCSLSILMVLLSTDLSIAKQVTFERAYAGLGNYQEAIKDTKIAARLG